MTLFSALNVEAARLARHGYAPAAMRVARAAEKLEASAEFIQLRDLLAGIPGSMADDVLNGVLPEDAPEAVADVLREIARRTERIRAAESRPGESAEWFAGRIREVTDPYVVIVAHSHGPATAVPRWMATEARRHRVGEALVLVVDRLDGGGAVVIAWPALDLDEGGSATDFSPFGRDDTRVLGLSGDDARMLSGEPVPLRVLVPVTIAA